MSLLDGIFGVQHVAVNGEMLPTRRTLNLIGAFTVTDNPANDSTDIEIGASVATSPADLNFVKIATIAYSVLVPPALTHVNESFSSDTGQFTQYTEGTAATFSVSGGTCTVTNGSGATRTNIVCEGPDLTMPQSGAQIDVVSRSGSPVGFDNIGVGVAKDGNNFVFASVDRIGGTVRIQVKIAGSSTFNAQVTRSLSVPYKLGFSLVGQSACAYVDVGNGWEFVTGYSIPTSTFNFKTGSLTGWKAAFTVATPGGNAAWTFDNFIAGRFGGVAARDLNAVTNEDGTPWLVGSTVYTSATLADGMGQSYLGVLQWDLETHGYSQTSAIMMSRGGSTQPDQAAHIIRYANGDRRICWGTWGNGIGGVIDTYHALLSGQEILSGSWIISGAKLNLPGQSAGYGCYDCMLVKDGSMWRAAYTLSTDTVFTNWPFYTAAATSSDLSTWTAVGYDRSTKNYEGTRFIRFGADLFIASGGFNNARVYDPSVNFRGFLRATMDGGTSAPPHPTIFKYGSKYVMITFDQQKATGASAVWTWGRIVVHEAPAQ